MRRSAGGSARPGSAAPGRHPVGARAWEAGRKAVSWVRRRPLLLAGLLVVALAGLWSWRAFQGPEVRVLKPMRGTAAEIVYATGAVEPVRWAKVASVIGDRIVEICDCEGKEVRKGDVLARLDDSELRAQLEELRAREEFARREMARQAELVNRGIASRQTYERVSMELQAIEALILVQRQKIDERTIKAPMDGVILRRDGEVGEIAEAGQILFQIGTLRPLRVVAEVNEEDIPRVALGQRVLLRTDAFAGRRLEGHVSEITPIGDPVAKTYRIKVALPDDTPLLPGMSVEANIVTREKPDALLIPADAVQGQTVYVAEGNRLRRRTIEIGIRGMHAVEVLSGLGEDERVASPALPSFYDGMRIRAVERPPAEPWASS